MECGCVVGGSKDEGGAGVEDGRAGNESKILTIDSDGECGLPETLRVDVIDGDEAVGIEFGLVKSSECDFAIVKTIGDTRDLVRCDGLTDQSLLRERFDGGQDTLVREGRLS